MGFFFNDRRYSEVCGLEAEWYHEEKEEGKEEEEEKLDVTLKAGEKVVDLEEYSDESGRPMVCARGVALTAVEAAEEMAKRVTLVEG